MTKAAIYIRVSTREQVENYSIPAQTEKLQAYCKAKGWEIQDTYIDGGYSGATTDRPALQRMLSEIKEIDIVVVYKLDRLSRSQRDTLELIEDHFLKNEVNFASVTENLDTSTPMGRAMIGIMSAFAQLERELIAERLREGHIKRAENGYRGMGGDYCPAGYVRSKGMLKIIEDEAIHISRAFDLYEQYHSITEVQKRLKEEGFPVWRFRRYRDILSNPLYTGHVTFSGKVYKGKHQAIITQEQFDRVQVLLDRHKGHNAHKAKKSLLSGLIKCHCCGESFVSYSTGISKKNPKTYYYYICRARRFPSEYDEKCMNKNWNRSKLEKLIINELKNLSIEKKKIYKEKQTVDYEKMIKNIDNKMNRLVALYASDTKITREIVETQIEELNSEKERLIQKLQSDKDNSPTITDDMLHNIRVNFEGLEFKEKQTIIQKLIKEIYIDGNNVIIDWRF